MSAPVSAEALLDKIKALPPERISQVADFVEFLATQDRRRAAGEALRKTWERMPNEEITEEIEQEIVDAVRAVRTERRSRGAS